MIKDTHPSGPFSRTLTPSRAFRAARATEPDARTKWGGPAIYGQPSGKDCTAETHNRTGSSGVGVAEDLGQGACANGAADIDAASNGGCSGANVSLKEMRSW